MRASESAKLDIVAMKVSQQIKVYRQLLNIRNTTVEGKACGLHMVEGAIASFARLIETTGD